VLDLLVHQNLRRFVIWYLLPRQIVNRGKQVFVLSPQFSPQTVAS